MKSNPALVRSKAILILHLAQLNVPVRSSVWRSEYFHTVVIALKVMLHEMIRDDDF